MNRETDRHEIRRDDDGALLGYVRRTGGGWGPLTVFGYPIGPAGPYERAEEEVRRAGLDVLAGQWEFLEDGEWYRCVILEASAGEVRVRPADHRYPHHRYALTLERPTPETLRPGR
ncbi:hypothetical protein [Microbispora sp. CSR-4]|uniref:hypothetical protein n=1 Tax=Microbispora sp. CSR-4 TaxID=2592813 RepID=UPI0011CC39CE|nr:hypothetical protein [Microbispora sp. CSR-4]